MKKSFTLIIATLLSFSMYAFPNQSILSVSVNVPNRFYVMVDGTRYLAANNSIILKNLGSGYHQVQVYQQRRGIRNSQFSNLQLLYNSRVYIRPQHFVDITINRFGRAFVDEQIISAFDFDNDDCDNNQNIHYHNNTSWNNNWNNNNWTNSGPLSGRIMNTTSFEQFKQTLRSESFENTKFNLAKQVISGNLFSTLQIKELMELFSFENTKLELAKYAYQFTADKGNYFTLANEFSFSSSKEALMRHIQNSR